MITEIRTDYRHHMRLLIMYDLPMISSLDISTYNKFHNFIIKRGYDMINYSVYVKTCKNLHECNKQLKHLKRHLPHYGNIRALKLTNKQYEAMEILRGEKTHYEQNLSNQKLIIIDD